MTEELALTARKQSLNLRSYAYALMVFEWPTTASLKTMRQICDLDMPENGDSGDGANTSFTLPSGGSNPSMSSVSNPKHEESL